MHALLFYYIIIIKSNEIKTDYIIIRDIIKFKCVHINSKRMSSSLSICNRNDQLSRFNSNCLLLRLRVCWCSLLDEKYNIKYSKFFISF